MENHSLFEVKDLRKETITATFVRGARVSFVTSPAGLDLNVNGRTNWPSYNFVGKPGDVYEVEAPEEQVGSDGRKYVFQGWSNGGDIAQTVTVPAEAVEDGVRLTARFDLLSQVVIESDPLGTPVEVNGETCSTPCSLDRADGTEVQVIAPARRTISNVHRLDFNSWSDGGSRERVVTLSGAERIKLMARYTTLYTLETKSDPPGGATFTMSPDSADGFYEEDTSVRVKVEANDGYRFRRWGADLAGTYPEGTVKMSAPRGVIARMDEVPFIPDAGIRNAAGETPEQVVAGGSIISIYGARLAPYLAVGPTSPLAQTLAGVTVRVGDRILALLYVSDGQINAVLPYDLPPGEYTLIVQRSGEEDVTGKFTVVRNAPGVFGRVFDGMILVMASHEDGTPVTPESPARIGETISIYGTGFGPYDIVAPYGFPLPSSPEYKLVDPIEVFAGEIPLQPEFTGGAPGYSGTDLLKLAITEALRAGSTPEFKVKVGGRESNTVLLPVE
ncbi:MAG: hypothetical protein GY953_31710 [bacterium]|nr:hypothetical protein [bacterium]